MEKNTRGNEIPKYMYGLAVAAVILLFVIIIFLVRRYTPTKEHMSLDDFFDLSQENEVAVILNGEYKEVTEEDTEVHSIVTEDGVYLEIGFVKDLLDDRYVYDEKEGILRYVTDKDVISASLDSEKYTVSKSKKTFEKPVVVKDNGAYYISIDFMMGYTDFKYDYHKNPNRVVLEQAGYEKQVATLKRKAPLRRFGGVKSKILEDGTKGEEVVVLENYGKWSHILTENGVLACVQNRKMTKSKTETVKATLPEEKHEHLLLDKDIILGWHQISGSAANATVKETLIPTNVNVVSPTWFYLDDNKGGIADNGSKEYVDFCHSRDIQVWGLVSNLENKNVDTTTVLNTTSARDRLVNNLIAAAITYELDGINVDMEQLSVQAKDGYIEFIRELSLKCENNDLILSVDNYVPSDSSAFYNRSEQAKYADYVIIMAYDEHYSGGDEAGSVASLGFVKKGVEDTLLEVPAEQTILAMPFYARVWAVSKEGITSKAYGMDEMDEYLKSHNANKTWLDAEGQYYAEYAKDDVTYQAWVEDATSLAKKMEVLKENKLAGGAFWKLGFENNQIWATVDNYLE